MSKNNKTKLSKITTLVLAFSLTGCISTDHQNKVLSQLSYPQQWQSLAHVPQTELETNNHPQQWLTVFQNQALNSVVALAKANNRDLLTRKADVELAEQQALIAGVTQLPEITLSQTNSRRKNFVQGDAQYQSNAELTLQFSYELDLWGKLSEQQSQATLDYLAAKNHYQQAEQLLMANVAKAWFNLVEAQQLLALYQASADNQKNNLEMIQSSYRLGLKDALDVYLTQNNVNSELARVAQQQQLLVERQRALELLIGQYPSGKFVIDSLLPEINHQIPTGLPANLLTQRADIVAAWYQLLALDAGVAVAHKQRFPRIALTSTVGDSSNELGKLLDGGSLAWSLIANLTMPLFDGGKLAAIEQQAKLRLAQQEQHYLELLYQAFAEVENTINNQAALTTRYQHLVKAQQNAEQAEKLSFEQYRRGLVAYTTVLESQRRSLDAQTSVIQLKAQLLQNRISLYLALGGSYEFNHDAYNQALSSLSSGGK